MLQRTIGESHLGVGVVAAPVGPDAGLAPQVPHLKLDVFVRHRLHIESNGCMPTATFSVRRRNSVCGGGGGVQDSDVR